MKRCYLSYLSLAVVLSTLGCGNDGTAGGEGGERGSAACEEASDCDDGLFCNGEEVCDSGSDDADDRGCVPGKSPCSQEETCVETARACEQSCGDDPDQDGDGHDSVACGGDDCDDYDALRFPGNAEICDANGHDEDCDPATLGFDLDRDGFVDDRCCNLQDDESLLCGTDCDDLRDTVNPTAIDSCNGVDDNCNGILDESPTLVFYRDKDGDNFGRPGDPDDLSIPEDERPVRACTLPKGYSLNDTDCNDEEQTAHPGAQEVCDPRDVDEDCDGQADEHGPGATTPAVALLTYYRDDDRDGWGVVSDSILSCNPSGDYRALNPNDCNDTRSDVHPGVSSRQPQPACPESYFSGDVAFLVEARWCSNAWECVESACGDLLSVPAIWDMNCSGAIEPRQKLACSWDQALGCGPATFATPQDAYSISACGRSTVKESYECSDYTDKSSCESGSGSGADTIAHCY